MAEDTWIDVGARHTQGLLLEEKEDGVEELKVLGQIVELGQG